LSYEARLSEALLPVETALDDIPALAVTDEDAFRLAQGRAIVLLPRQVETLKAELTPGDRTVSAMSGRSWWPCARCAPGSSIPCGSFNSPERRQPMSITAERKTALIAEHARTDG
jgi:tRNA pseudouridine55 synthase